MQSSVLACSYTQVHDRLGFIWGDSCESTWHVRRWNPAVEQQAMDRIHRLGQFKPIRVVRFVIGGTIEERILKLQEKKLLVFEGTVGRDAEALGRLTEDDMRFLFA